MQTLPPSLRYSVRHSFMRPLKPFLEICIELLACQAGRY